MNNDNPTCTACGHYNAILNGACRDCGVVAATAAPARMGKVNMCGGFVAIVDVETNQDVFTSNVPKSDGGVALLVKRAARRGYTLVNVRDGKIWL